MLLKRVRILYYRLFKLYELCGNYSPGFLDTKKASIANLQMSVIAIFT